MAHELAQPLLDLLQSLETKVIDLVSQEQFTESTELSEKIYLKVKMLFKDAQIKFIEQLKLFSGKEYCQELRESYMP